MGKNDKPTFDEMCQVLFEAGYFRNGNEGYRDLTLDEIKDKMQRIPKIWFEHYYKDAKVDLEIMNRIKGKEDKNEKE